jgi:hypothetical protein
MPSKGQRSRVDVIQRAEAGQTLTQAQIKEIVDKAVIASRADVEAQVQLPEPRGGDRRVNDAIRSPDGAKQNPASIVPVARNPGLPDREESVSPSGLIRAGRPTGSARSAAGGKLRRSATPRKAAAYAFG